MKKKMVVQIFCETPLKKLLATPLPSPTSIWWRNYRPAGPTPAGSPRP